MVTNIYSGDYREMPNAQTDFPQLLAVFFAEFDPVQGPVVTYSAPAGFLKSNHTHVGAQKHDETSLTRSEHSLDFDLVSEYIIPKPELCQSILTICTNELKILSYPQLLSSTKYPRNALIFNLCFVFDRGAMTKCYEAIVRKSASFLRDIELESEYLFRQESKRQLQGIVEQLLETLNRDKGCSILFNDANMLNLHLFSQHPEPSRVSLDSVPVLLRKLPASLLQDWDLTIQTIAPYINGVYHVAKISQLADVDIQLVIIAVRHLLYFQVCELVDWFKPSNIYSVCYSTVSSLFSDPRTCESCFRFVVAPNYQQIMDHPSFPATSEIDLFYVCTLFQPSRTVSQIVSENSALFQPHFELENGSLIDYQSFLFYAKTSPLLEQRDDDAGNLSIPPGVQPALSSVPSSPKTPGNLDYSAADQPLRRGKKIPPLIDVQRVVVWGAVNGALCRLHRIVMANSPTLLSAFSKGTLQHLFGSMSATASSRNAGRAFMGHGTAADAASGEPTFSGKRDNAAASTIELAPQVAFIAQSPKLLRSLALILSLPASYDFICCVLDVPASYLDLFIQWCNFNMKLIVSKTKAKKDFGSFNATKRAFKHKFEVHAVPDDEIDTTAIIEETWIEHDLNPLQVDFSTKPPYRVVKPEFYP